MSRLKHSDHPPNPLRRRISNQRRELRRLNRLLQTLRGFYREAARSSLERVCLELAKERDAARKECERLQTILDKPEGRIRQESEVIVTDMTAYRFNPSGSVDLSGQGGGGPNPFGDGSPGVVSGTVEDLKKESYFLSPGRPGRVEFRCSKCDRLLCQKPFSERVGSFPQDYYCPNCSTRGRAPDGADGTATTPAQGGKGGAPGQGGGSGGRGWGGG